MEGKWLMNVNEIHPLKSKPIYKQERKAKTKKNIHLSNFILFYSHIGTSHSKDFCLQWLNYISARHKWWSLFVVE